MPFLPTAIQGLLIFEPKVFEDNRGYFFESYNENIFKEQGIDTRWVQDNQSCSPYGVIRGLHYQLPPFAEIKLVRCIAGAVFDVIVDLRKNSDTFLQWFGTELSATNKKMIYIPQGFAHGFETLSDDCELLYHHSQYYQPGSEGGIKYDDKLINIAWPGEVTNISKRDEEHPLLDKNFEGINV